jgi:hydroxyacylglutathione hydrolase
MSILTFTCGPIATNTYIVYCPKTLDAAIFDAPPESLNDILSAVREYHLKPKSLLLTHSHWDHTAEAYALAKSLDLKVGIHALDLENLEKPGSDGLPCWLDIPPVKPDFIFKEGDHIPIGKLDFEVIETPGHTPGGVCFYEPAHKILMAGDTLFQGSIGHLSFSTARPTLMWISLKKLSKLPPDTKVYPGHGPSTTIGNEPWLGEAERYFG